MAAPSSSSSASDAQPSAVIRSCLSTLAALANPGEVVRRALLFEEELKGLLRLRGGAAAARSLEGSAKAAQSRRERFVRAYERLKDELLTDRAFDFDFNDETRQWVAEVASYSDISTWLMRAIHI